ncbi:MAG: hypothetical protein Q8Q86_01120 [Candidatus Daviesbacteria bacterium]|nr:hypothetical protein [Candidatus Daviesbacteria bacterium]
MSQKLFFWIGLSPLIISLIITIIILTLFKFLPPKLPLFYSLPWGEEQLATPQQFLMIPASISLIALLNLIIAWQLHPQQSFFKKVLSLSSAVVGIISTVTFIKIILNFV